MRNMNMITVRQTFNELKVNYERIREFKSAMAEKMLRSALTSLLRTSKR
jgi:hypothetical protein